MSRERPTKECSGNIAVLAGIGANAMDGFAAETR